MPARIATFRGNDDGVYYTRELADGTVVWFGEWSPPGLSFDGGFQPHAFANVFVGRRTGPATIEGTFTDVPKGRGTGAGSLRVEEVSHTRWRIVSSGFGGTEFTLVLPGERSDSGVMRPAYMGSDATDLTGLWVCDDGGAYYVRHLGSSLVWYGEHPEAAFANVFTGTVIAQPMGGLEIRGRWIDLQKHEAGTTGQGDLVLMTSSGRPGAMPTPLDHARMTRMGSSGPFGGTTWNKVDVGTLVCNIHTFHLNRQNETSGDEPYLWIYFIKVDGDTVDLTSIGTADVTIHSEPGKHMGNLTDREDIKAVAHLPIPPGLGSHTTRLQTWHGAQPLTSAIRQGTLFAVAVIVLEHDATARPVVRTAFREATRVLQEGLDTLLRRTLRAAFTAAATSGTIDTAALMAALTTGLAAVQEEVKSTVKSVSRQAALEWLNVGSVFDPDDRIGEPEIRIFTIDQLRAARDGRTPLSLEFRGDSARYFIDGMIEFD